MFLWIMDFIYLSKGVPWGHLFNIDIFKEKNFWQACDEEFFFLLEGGEVDGSRKNRNSNKEKGETS